MRKYRGMTKDKEWIYGWLVGVGDRRYIARSPEVSYSDDSTEKYCTIWGFIEVIPETVGQETDWKDNKGTKIYQGDKLKYAGLEGYLIVKWETFGWRLENTIPEIDRYIQKLSWPPIQLPSGNFEHIEIIGNIHQHPNLLEQE